MVLTETLELISMHGYGAYGKDRASLEFIEATDTSRPDGSIARHFEAP